MPPRIRHVDSRTIVTAHDVAREAGVSQSAVSRAFTPGASIAEGTRVKVLRAAELLGYQPNLLARSLISGRSNIVGVGVSSLRNPFFTEALDLLSISLEAAGLRLLLFPIGEATVAEADVQEVLHYRLDALILLSTTMTSDLASQCRRAQVPVVLFNRVSQDSDVSSVTGNNEEGARVIAAYLHAGGHKKPAMIAGLAGSSTSDQRERGFLSYFAEAGLPEPPVERGDFQHERAAAAARRLLSPKWVPDAIFCANDATAFAAIDVARFEFGLKPGRDISIIGFDNVRQAAWPAFSLTTFAQPLVQMVERTVEIIQSLRLNPLAITHAVLNGELVIRSSTIVGNHIG